MWVKVVGLPLHFWCRETLKKIGDSYRVFVKGDEDTARGQQMQWARVLVRSTGSETSGTLQMVEGLVVYAIHLWWEVPPCLTHVEPKGETNGWKDGDEGEGQSRVVEGMSRQSLNLQKEIMDLSPPSGGGRLVGMVLPTMLGLAGRDVDKRGVLGDGGDCVVEQGVDYPCVESLRLGVESGLNFVRGPELVEA